MKIKIILLFNLIISGNFFAQHNLVFDTSYVSLTHKTEVKGIMISDDNSVWTKFDYGDFISGAWVNSTYLERRSEDNIILWQNFGINYFLMGFDDEGNLFANKVTDYLFRINKSNGNVNDSVLINGVGGANSIVKASDGGYIIDNIQEVGSGWGKIIRTDENFNILYTISITGGDVLDYEITNNRIALIYRPSSGDPTIRIYDYQSGLYLGQVNNSGYDYYHSLTSINETIFFTKSRYESSYHNTGIYKINNDLTTTTIHQRTSGDFLEILSSSDNKLFSIYGNYGNYPIGRIAKLDTLGAFFPDSIQGLTMNYDTYSGFSINGNLVFTGKSFSGDSLIVETYDESLNLNVNYSNFGGESFVPVLSNVSNSGCFVVSGNNQNFSVPNAHLLKFCTPDASIEEQYLQLFSIYPNPANTSLTLKFNQNISNEKVVIQSVSGQVVYEYKIDESTTDKEFKIDISTLNSGIYFVKIDNHTEKLIIE